MKWQAQGSIRLSVYVVDIVLTREDQVGILQSKYLSR